jgi:hypothetical protein
MKNGNGWEARLGKIEDLLRMTALQTAENAKQLKEQSLRFDRELKKSRAEHDREMKEIRVLFKQMIKRIAV